MTDRKSEMQHSNLFSFFLCFLFFFFSDTTRIKMITTNKMSVVFFFAAFIRFNFQNSAMLLDFRGSHS